MLAFKDLEKNIVTSIKAKKDLVLRSAFPKLPLSLDLKPIIVLRIAYKKVTKVEVAYALMT